VAFVDDIAKAVGDAPDSRDSDCPNKKTTRLNSSSGDRKVTRPVVYVEHLIELNPNREAPDMFQDCKGRGVPQQPPVKTDSGSKANTLPAKKESSIKKTFKGVLDKMKKPN